MRSRPMLAVARKDALDLIFNPGTLAVLFIPLLVALLFALLSSALSPTTSRLLISSPGGPVVEITPGPFYALLSVITSCIVGASLMPNLLIEEKERKTLWMLLVSPATMTDIVAGKLLVGLGYQMVLSLVTLAVQRAFTRQTLVIALFILLGASLTVAMGLLVGSVFRSVHVGGPFTGIIALLFLIPAFFASPLGTMAAGGPLQQIIRLLPTYYLADGLLAALQDQATLQQVATDGVVALGTALVFFAAAVWVLRRQTAVTVSA